MPENGINSQFNIVYHNDMKCTLSLLLLENNATQATQGLFFTALLGLYFTALQAYEYFEAGGYPKLGHDHFHVHFNSLFTPRHHMFGATDSVIKRIVIKDINNLQEDVRSRTSRLKLTVPLHSI